MGSQFTHLLGIAFKLFKRDFYRGELLILIFVMSLVMASVSSIFLVIDRIENATASEVSDVLGADLVVTSPAEIDESWLQDAEKYQLESARSIEFSSVLFANENIQLSSIKAVSDNFPLKGQFQVADAPYQPVSHLNRFPESGKIWAEPRILNALNLNKGDSVELGYADFVIDGALMRQPGQGSTLFNISPTVVMNINDVERTQIIQPGSRVNYRYLFVGDRKNIELFNEFLKEKINSSQRLVTIYDESPLAGSALLRSKKYLSLSTLLTMIIVAITIAMSANRYAIKQYDMSALMRCFGMTRQAVLKVFIMILGFVSLFGIIIGGGLGIFVENIASQLFAKAVIDGLPDADYRVLIYPVMASLLMLFGFSLPALFRIKQVSPMRVLRRNLSPAGLKTGAIYLLSLATFVLVMWLQMGDLKLLLNVVLSLVAVLLVFSLIAYGLLKAVLPMSERLKNPAMTYSLRQLNANKGMSLLHLLAFSLAIFVIAIIILVRGELIGKWQQSLGENVPNHFLINVKPDEVKPIQSFLESQQVESSGLYPMVRGRITGINNQDVKDVVPESGQNHNSLRRELNLTWSESIPLGNHLVEGEWKWPEQNPSDSNATARISLEEKTADALGLKIGDIINFTIGSEPWQAEIVNIRYIDWQTFTPNFYVIANPGTLDKFGATYITSMHLERSQKNLLNQLVKEYPGISVIELDLILEEIQSIIGKVSKAVEVIMVFVVLAGVALLVAALNYTLDTKYKQSAILRTLGASQRFISQSFRYEYIWLAMLSSIMALIAIELVSLILYSVVFEIEYQIHWDFWLIIPIANLMLMLFASWRGVRKVTYSSPLILLRQS